MNPRPAAALLLCCGVAAAQSPTPAAAPSATPEPHVQHTVIEDDGVRVEELRVRGQVRRIVVHTKGERGSTYEIVPADGARDMSPNPTNSRGAAGKSLWTVLAF